MLLRQTFRKWRERALLAEDADTFLPVTALAALLDSMRADVEAIRGDSRALLEDSRAMFEDVRRSLRHR